MIYVENLDSLEGIHGEYFKLSDQVGVKVIHSKGYPSIKKLVSSNAFQKAKREAEILMIAEETGVVPKCYGLTVVKSKSGFRAGVLMQHLGQVTLADSDQYDNSEIYDYLVESLKEVGIKHWDLHEDNIMVYRGKMYAVDFSPDCVSVK